MRRLTTVMKSLVTLSMVFGASSAIAATRYDQVRAFLYQLAQTYPQTTQIFDLGVNNDGEVIKAVKIGNGPVKNLVVGTHHGNEYGATEVATAFALSMAQQPDPNMTMYVIPVLNINGYNANSRNETLRTTGESLDPNRDYPGPCATSGPFKLKSTNLLAQFIATENIVASATLHTFYPVVAYPWGISTQDTSTPYDNIFIQLGKAATIESGFPVGNSTQAIYPADGTYEDYSFWKHGMWTLLFELGHTHSPDPGEVQELIRGNVPGLRRFLAMAPPQRAPNHDFTGRCERGMKIMDRHDE